MVFSSWNADAKDGPTASVALKFLQVQQPEMTPA
jgi:hypothetical protein